MGGAMSPSLDVIPDQRGRSIMLATICGVAS
jgi:hypothetical protein